MTGAGSGNMDACQAAEGEACLLKAGCRSVVKKRVAWVDLIRVLALFIILWKHASMPEWLDIPTTASVFVYFLLAGYFCRLDSRNLWLRAWRILRTYAAWMLIALPLACGGLWSAYRGGGAEFLSYAYECFIGNPDPVADGPLWFLKELFVFQCVLAVASLIGPARMMAGCLAVFLLARVYAVDGMHYYSYALNAIPFFVGVVCSRFSLQDAEDWFRGVRWHVAAIIAAVAACALWLQRDAVQDGAQGYIGMRMFYFLICAGALCAAVEGCRLFPRACDWLASYGSLVMFIYAGHMLLFKVFNYACRELGMPDWRQEYGFAAALATFVVLAVAAKLLNRVCPGVMRVLMLK